ncbi:hypothetical protein [Cohnella caldifontis]|uniref:hypothetical protein n=1 Tax=Cohnella caldifontis TaxID=3027471 RepID=UPI0023ECB3ED|nr:hypothetical protein [Cohnella sp. YIM B05605]
MNKKFRKYVPAIEEYLLQGQEMHHVEGALYRAGNYHFELHISEPNAKRYFFPVNFYPEARMCVFLCGHEMLAYCFTPEELQSLPLYRAKSGDFYVFNIVAEHPLNGEGELHCRQMKVNITDCAVPLYETCDFGEK